MSEHRRERISACSYGYLKWVAGCATTECGAPQDEIAGTIRCAGPINSEHREVLK